MKKNKLIYVLTYNDEVLSVCSTKAIARAIAAKHVKELNYFVDRFSIKELPMVSKI